MDTKAEELFAAQVCCDEDVHRNVSEMTRGTNLVRQSKTTIKFHGSRVAAFHLWVLQVCLVPFDKQDRHAALGKIDGKGLPDRTCADDKNVGLAGARCVS